MKKVIGGFKNGTGIVGKRVIATIALGALAVVSAFATDPPPANDYSEAITSFKTDMSGFLQTNGPGLLGALVVMLAFGLVWKFIKRAAKS